MKNLGNLDVKEQFFEYKKLAWYHIIQNTKKTANPLRQRKQNLEWISRIFMNLLRRERRLKTAKIGGIV